MKTFAISLCLLAASLPAAAQPSQSSAASIAEFDRGRALMKAQDFPAACQAFERSQQLEAAPGTLYNLATCYTRIGKLASAWAAFRELSASDPNADRRAASADAARALDKRLPRLLLTVPSAPADLVVTLNGFDVTSSLGIDNPVDLGTHEVIARATGFAELKLAPAITQEGKTVAVELALVPLPATAAASGATDVAPTPRTSDADIDTPGEPGARQRIGGVVTAGLGGAVAITGLVFGVQARSRWHDAQAACPGNVCSTEADRELEDRARDRATLSTVFVIGGVAMAAAGVAIYLTAPRAPVRVTPTANGVAIGGSF